MLPLFIDAMLLALLVGVYMTIDKQFKLYNKQIAELHNAVQGENASALTEYEEMKMEREALFDARIEQMKNELAGNQAPRTGEVADELHPNVKNIAPRETDINRNREAEVAE